MKIIKRAITVLMLSIMTIQLCACGVSSGLNTDIDSNDNIDSTDDTNMDWKQYQGVWVNSSSPKLEEVNGNLIPVYEIDLVVIDESGVISCWDDVRFYLEIGKIGSYKSKNSGWLESSDTFMIDASESRYYAVTGPDFDDALYDSVNFSQPFKHTICANTESSTVKQLNIDWNPQEWYYPLESYTSWEENGLTSLIQKFIELDDK